MGRGEERDVGRGRGRSGTWEEWGEEWDVGGVGRGEERGGSGTWEGEGGVGGVGRGEERGEEWYMGRRGGEVGRGRREPTIILGLQHMHR